MNKCKICGSSIELVHKGTRDRADIDVYECVACHTKQLSIIGVNDYSNGFMNGSRFLSHDEIKKRLGDCRNDDVRRAKYVMPMIVGKSVLDFGCGFGGFLQEIKGAAAKCEGVELSKQEREYVLSQNISCFEDISETSTRYDYITLFHVFEHLELPVDYLRKLCSHLNDEGMLIIEVPNSNDALLSMYNCSAFADFTYWSAHLYLYSINGFKMIVDQVPSLELVKVEQIQRYPLANHLYWLACGLPGGGDKWNLLLDEELDDCYAKVLSKLQACDTLMFTLRKRKM